jgi:mannosyltransferase
MASARRAALRERVTRTQLSTDARRVTTAVAVAAIVLLALGLRLIGLGNDSLWLDEGFSVKVAHLRLLSLPEFLADYDTHPPLYYALLHCWIVLFGDSETAVRSLSVVFGVLLVPVMYELGRLLGGRAAGLTAALLAAVSPFFVRYSQETRNYALLALLTAVSLLFLLRLRDHPTRPRAVAFVLATALLLYTHAYGVFVVLAEAVIVALDIRAVPAGPARRTALRRWIPVGIAVGALFLPWFIVLIRQMGEEVAGGARANLSWLDAPSGADVLRSFGTFSGSPKASLVFLLIAGVLAVGIRRVGARSQWALRRAASPLVVLLVASMAVPFVLSYLLAPIYYDRYLMAAAVAYYLLFAVAIGFVASARLRLLLAGALTIVLLAGAIDYQISFEKNDWRSAVQYLETRASTGDLVLFDVPFTQDDIFDYYARREDLTKRWAGQKNALADNSTPPAQVWLVTAYPNVSSSVFPEELGSEYEERLARDFVGVDVRLYERRTEDARPT